MSKIIVGVLALLGCLVAITTYVPSLWSSGFMLGTFNVRYAYFALGAVGYLVYKMKVK